MIILRPLISQMANSICKKHNNPPRFKRGGLYNDSNANLSDSADNIVDNGDILIAEL